MTQKKSRIPYTSHEYFLSSRKTPQQKNTPTDEKSEGQGGAGDN
jgi:hypothetical protein